MSDNLEFYYGFVKYKRGNYLKLSHIVDIHIISIQSDMWALMAALPGEEIFVIKDNLTEERAEKLREDLVKEIHTYERLK